jgi:hypothetical protein
MSDAQIPRKISVSEGRTRLKVASFSPGPNTGQRYEIWRNRHGFPVSVSYYGRDYDYFANASLEHALAQKDTPLN